MFLFCLQRFKINIKKYKRLMLLRFFLKLSSGLESYATNVACFPNYWNSILCQIISTSEVIKHSIFPNVYWNFMSPFHFSSHSTPPHFTDVNLSLKIENYQNNYGLSRLCLEWKRGRKENACGLNIKENYSRINFRQKVFERGEEDERAEREERMLLWAVAVKAT